MGCDKQGCQFEQRSTCIVSQFASGLVWIQGFSQLVRTACVWCLRIHCQCEASGSQNSCDLDSSISDTELCAPVGPVAATVVESSCDEDLVTAIPNPMAEVKQQGNWDPKQIGLLRAASAGAAPIAPPAAPGPYAGVSGGLGIFGASDLGGPPRRSRSREGDKRKRSEADAGKGDEDSTSEITRLLRGLSAQNEETRKWQEQQTEAMRTLATENTKFRSDMLEAHNQLVEDTSKQFTEVKNDCKNMCHEMREDLTRELKESMKTESARLESMMKQNASGMPQPIHVPDPWATAAQNLQQHAKPPAPGGFSGFGTSAPQMPHAAAAQQSESAWEPEHVFLRGWCGFGEEEQKGMSSAEASRIWAQMLALLPNEIKQSVVKIYAPYRKNRQIRITVRGGSKGCWDLKEAITEVVAQRDLTYGGCAFTTMVDKPEWMKQRDGQVGKAAAALRSAAGTEHSNKVICQWKKAAVCWKRQDSSEVCVGKLINGSWKWHDQRLKDCLPGSDIPRLLTNLAEGADEDW